MKSCNFNRQFSASMGLYISSMATVFPNHSGNLFFFQTLPKRSAYRLSKFRPSLFDRNPKHRILNFTTNKLKLTRRNRFSGFSLLPGQRYRLLDYAIVHTFDTLITTMTEKLFESSFLATFDVLIVSCLYFWI